MDSIHQAKVKSGHLLHKIALVQSQRNSTVFCRIQNAAKVRRKYPFKKTTLDPNKGRPMLINF